MRKGQPNPKKHPVSLPLIQYQRSVSTQPESSMPATKEDYLKRVPPT
jgi:hypothetical protein